MIKMANSISVAMIRMEIIAYAQVGNPEKKTFKILVAFDCSWLPVVVLLPLSSAVLFVDAPVKCGETAVDCDDDLRVLGSVEVLTVGLFDLDASVFRASVMSKQIP